MAFTHSVPSEIHLQAGILPEPGNVPIAADSPDTAFCLSCFILRKTCKSANPRSFSNRPLWWKPCFCS